MMYIHHNIPNREEVLGAVACPKCGAERGEPCVQPPGKTHKRTSALPPNHQDRVRAARKALSKSK